MIDALYRLPAPDGALLLLSRLYDDVEDQDTIAAWEEYRAVPPPFCWRLAGDDYKPLQDAMDRSRSVVTSHLAKLTKLGVIRRKKRDGRSGWELLGTRRSPPATSENPDADVPILGRPGPKTLTRTSENPDVRPAPSVPIPGPGGPDPRTSTSRSPDPTRARVGIKQEPDLARRGGAANDRPGQVSAAASTSTATSSRTTPEPARRTALPVGEPVPPRPASREGPPRALLLRLVRHFDEQYVPTIDGRPVEAGGTPLESRRIHADVDTLRRLAELLTPPEDVDADVVEAWRERRVATVTAYVEDYAKICAVDPEQARQWGGDMLEPRIRTGVRSAWQTLTRIVDRWREEQAAAAAAAAHAAAEARVAEARAVAERLDELAVLARDGETAFARQLRANGQAAPPRRDHVADHAAARRVVEAARAAGRPPTLAEVNAAVAAVPPLDDEPARPLDTTAKILDSLPATSELTPLPPLPPMQSVVEPPVRELTDDEEAEIRERGRRREGRGARALDTEQLASQRISTIIREFTEQAGRSPTPAESEQISRLVRGKEATGT